VPRGAYFLFISAKAMATIEFLQQEWINDGDFMSTDGERDPIIGLQQEGAAFTIPRDPVRRVVHGIETFNVLRGGSAIPEPPKIRPLAFCTLRIEFICALCCLSAFTHYGFILMSQKNPETESVRDQQ
jgi:hypothetical protein